MALGSTYHGDPSEGGDALADGTQVVEQWRGAVLLAVRLDRLDGLRRRRQQFHQVGIGGLLRSRRHHQELALGPSRVNRLSYLLGLAKPA